VAAILISTHARSIHVENRLGGEPDYWHTRRMDWVQLHLALNHLPVIGVPLLVAMLVIGWWRGSSDVLGLTLWLLTLLPVAAIAIKFTGDFAAEQAAQQLAPVRDYVARHEEAGDQGTTGVFFLGLASALALFLSRQGRPRRAWTLALVVVLGLLTSLLYARAAHRGGEISHPELR
jgi:hypothetical protein